MIEFMLQRRREERNANFPTHPAGGTPHTVPTSGGCANFSLALFVVQLARRLPLVV